MALTAPLDTQETRLDTGDPPLTLQLHHVAAALAAYGLLAALQGLTAVPAACIAVAFALLLAACVRAVRARATAEADARALATDLEHARRELEDARRYAPGQERLSALGTMAAGLAHEISNPMSYVTANVSALADALARAGELPPALRAMSGELSDTLDGIQRVNAIVADLRAFSREGPLEPCDFDLNREVEAALRIAQGHLRGKAEVRRSLGKLVPAYGRPHQIAQVIVNLLVNAAQAMPARGVVSVTTRCDPDELSVEVKDTGVGMTPETVAKLFRPFFTTKPVGVGTGLGLAVANGIVRAHGGRIEVRSAPGQGSTFTVRLPRPAATRGFGARAPRPPGPPATPAAPRDEDAAAPL